MSLEFHVVHKPETTGASEIGIERMLWPGNRGTRDGEILEMVF